MPIPQWDVIRRPSTSASTSPARPWPTRSRPPPGASPPGPRSTASSTSPSWVRSSPSRSPSSLGRDCHRRGCTRRRAACSTPSGCRTRGWTPGSSATCAGCRARACPWSSRSLASRSTSSGSWRSSWSARAASRRSRSTCPAPTSSTGDWCSPVSRARRRPSSVPSRTSPTCRCSASSPLTSPTSPRSRVRSWTPGPTG